MKFITNFAWKPQAKEKITGMFEPNGIIQTFVDSEYIRTIERYVPFKMGVAVKSVTINTRIGSGLVIWRTPYIRYLYYGKVMIGRAPKKVTNKELTFHSGSVRGSKWHARWKADNIKQFMENVNAKTRWASDRL